jgi:hypothetical protein
VEVRGAGAGQEEPRDPDPRRRRQPEDEEARRGRRLPPVQEQRRATRLPREERAGDAAEEQPEVVPAHRRGRRDSGHAGAGHLRGTEVDDAELDSHAHHDEQDQQPARGRQPSGATALVVVARGTAAGRL